MCSGSSLPKRNYCSLVLFRTVPWNILWCRPIEDENNGFVKGASLFQPQSDVMCISWFFYSHRVNTKTFLTPQVGQCVDRVLMVSCFKWLYNRDKGRKGSSSHVQGQRNPASWSFSFTHVFVEILYREEKTKAKPHYLGKLGRTTAAEVNQECQAQSSV